MLARRSDKIGYLQMVDIFQDLTEVEMEEIDRATTITTSRRGKILYMPEDTSEVLFLLKEEVYSSTASRQTGKSW